MFGTCQAFSATYTLLHIPKSRAATMAIDYSKWDKLEISDDSDIEVHPNVDKRSFIRWKQQDIHQKRLQRNQDIKNLEVQIPMYEELNKRVDKMLAALDDDKLAKLDECTKYLMENFANTKADGVEEDAPTYNEMIEDLLIQLKGNLEKAKADPTSGENIRAEILAHRKKIDDLLVQQKDKLQSLYKERELHISSEDIHTGFDRSFLNKGESKPPAPEAPTNAAATAAYTTPAPSTSTPTTTKPAQTTPSAPKSSPAATESVSFDLTTTKTTQATSADEEETIEDVHPDLIALSKIPITSSSQIKDFLKTHTHIIQSAQKDALLMKAFDAQFNHDDARTKQIIQHSTLIQYVIDLITFKRASHPREIGIIIDGLFDKMFKSRSNPAYEAFEQEVSRTFAHIKQRCEVLAQENAMEGEQEIQLKSLDDNAELVVNLPDPASEDPEEKKRFEVFKTLPQAMQDALNTGSLDAVNAVFHGMPIEEAEKILEIFDECEVIGVQAVLENEQEWNELKEAAAHEQSHEKPPRIEELEIREDTPEFISTADLVD